MRVVDAKTKYGECRLYTDAPDEKLEGYDQVGDLEYSLKKQGYNARILKRYWFSEKQLKLPPMTWINSDGSHRTVDTKVHYLNRKAYTMIGDECNFDDAVLVHDDENDLK